MVRFDQIERYYAPMKSAHGDVLELYGTVLFCCLECGSMVQDAYLDRHVIWHGELAHGL